jgi:hypothetical protein
MKKSLVIGAVALLIAGGAAIATVQILNRPSEDAAVELIPADAYVYANLFISPSTDQRRALDDLLSNFPKIESTDQAINRLTGILDDGLREIGLSYEEDVEPWAGDQVSFFLSGDEIDPPAGAALLETTDPDAAVEAIDKAREAEGGVEPEQKSYGGIDYTLEGTDGDDRAAIGFVDDFMVVGTEDGFKAVVDASEDEEPLTDTDEYQEAFGDLDDQNIFSLYVNQGRVFELLEENGELGPEETAIFDAFPGIQDGGSSAFVLSAQSNGVAFEFSSPVPEDAELSGVTRAFLGTDLIETLPADSWLAIGIPELGTFVQDVMGLANDVPDADESVDEAEDAFSDETGLDLQDDVLSWMGDAALFVQGTNFQEIGGGVIVESNDPDATKAALGKIRDLVEEEGAPTEDAERGQYEGFSVQAGAPAPLYALAADRFIVTYGERATDDAVDPGETLGDDGTFQTAEDALGDGYSPSIYVDFDGLVAVIEFARTFSGAGEDSYEDEVKPWLDPISFLVSGSRQDGDRLFQRLFVGVETEDA